MSLFIEDKSIRTLIVNDTEKYRLLIDDSLKYAKGLINFNPNQIRDGRGLLIPYDTMSQNSIYAFFNDGFYSYNTDTWTYLGNNLNNNLTSSAAVFNGWYTAPTGGQEINSIADIYNYTKLFDYKDSKSIPTITLYAHWTLNTYNVTIYNITRRDPNNRNIFSQSSFEYIDNNKKKLKTGGFITLTGIPYNTELISYIHKYITKPKYVTWARNKLDGTQYQQELRNGPQSFKGWYSTDNGNGSIYNHYYITSNVNFYPQFAPLVIFYSSQDLNRGKYYVGNAPWHKNQIEALAPTDSQFFNFPGSFPLGSADTCVATLII